ncbi:MAG: hypothetical protein ACAI44_20990 [Candidatus Sericytochromatia bacterium]
MTGASLSAAGLQAQLSDQGANSLFEIQAAKGPAPQQAGPKPNANSNARPNGNQAPPQGAPMPPPGPLPKALIDALKANPTLWAAFEALKGLPPQEHYAKLQALLKDYPELLKLMPKPPGQGGTQPPGPGAGKPPGQNGQTGPQAGPRQGPGCPPGGMQPPGGGMPPPPAGMMPPPPPGGQPPSPHEDADEESEEYGDPT